MVDVEFQNKVINMVDDLKSVCAKAGLGNDGNEYKVITQTFLYKFLHDKFVDDFCKAENKKRKDFSDILEKMSDSQYNIKLRKITSVKFKKEHLLITLLSKSNDDNFAKTFDDTLISIADNNRDIVAIKTSGGSEQPLFEGVTKFVSDNKNNFSKTILEKIQNFDFGDMFEMGYDFFATIFEYIVKDYNSDSGGKYAEYYTPHSISRVISSILIFDKDIGKLKSKTCYDPSAGSGTLLMCLSHRIGKDRCSVYSQDISQKSSNLLRLNLILNNNIGSLHNVVQGDTILTPKHNDKLFDYIVSNPPFKLDFSDYQPQLNTERFWAGIPTIPKNKKETMSIYQLFIQHLTNKLSANGKGAIVLPTGFLTGGGIDYKIRKQLIDKKWLAGIVSMPSNIFASTGTSVSILFIDKKNKGDVILIDASNLGSKQRIDGNQRTVLSTIEEKKIIDNFHNEKTENGFSVKISYEDIINKNYSLSPGQHFEIKTEYIDITADEFNQKMTEFSNLLDESSVENRRLEKEIKQQLFKVNFDGE